MNFTKKRRSAKSDNPFKLSITKDGKIRFSRGLIFNIYEESKNKSGENSKDALKESCDFCAPNNNSEEFEFEAGDKFYIKIERSYIQNSEIVKADSDYVIDEDYDYVLICQVNESGTPIQLLTQNIFIQDRSFAQKKAFQVSRTGDKEYKIEGGFVICRASGVIKFVEGTTFSIQGDLPLIQQQTPEKIIYLVVNYTCDTEAVTEDAYESYEILSSATLQSATLEEETKAKKRSDLFSLAPKTGKSGEETSGKFYIPIYPPNLSQVTSDPREGNVYIKPTIKRFFTKIASDPFQGSSPVQDPNEDGDAPAIYHISFTSDIDEYNEEEFTSKQAVDILIDEDYTGGEPIDVSFYQTNYSLLEIEV